MRQIWNKRFKVIGLAGVLLGLFILPFILGGCDSDDCVNCIELPPPVVPTGVHSISGDDLVIVQWYDISYFPYDGNYNANVVSYGIYRRDYEDGDYEDPNREFYFLGEVDWNDENFDIYSGLHKFEDWEVENGERYEYAVTAINVVGAESALSYEFVTDAPLPMSLVDRDGNLIPVTIFGAAEAGDPNSIYSGFDFSDLDSRAIDPFAVDSAFDIRVFFQGAVPYVQTAGPSVLIQDFGMFVDRNNELVFEGVSWAPADYYSSTGVMELILGHIYVMEILDTELHYAKFGVVEQDNQSVGIVWAFQTIDGLPELKAPPEPKPETDNPQISL